MPASRHVIASEHVAVEEICGEEKVRVAIPSIQDLNYTNGFSFPETANNPAV